MIKEELCEKVVEVRRKSDRIMAMVLAFEGELVRLICAYGPQGVRALVEKNHFYEEMKDEWSVKSNDEIVLNLKNFNGHIGKEIEGFEGVHGGYGIGERNAEIMLLEFCDEKELCVANAWFHKKHNRNVTFKAGEFATEIDFVLIGKEQRKNLKDIKTIPWE